MVGLVDIAYLICCPITALAGLRSRSSNNARSWFALSLGVLALGLLRVGQFGLWVDNCLEQGLYYLGWYSQRRPLQVTGIGLFALALIVALRRFRFGSRRSAIKSAIGGFCILATLAVIRLSSLHWSDAILQTQVGPLTLSHATQILSLLTISSAAVLELGYRR